jgi:hypothetical protein
MENQHPLCEPLDPYHMIIVLCLLLLSPFLDTPPLPPSLLQGSPMVSQTYSGF